MSADLFNLLLEIVMRLAERGEGEVGVMINGMTLNNLRFADDINLIADTEGNLQQLTDRIDGSSRRMGLRINTGKTKTMGKQHEALSNYTIYDAVASIGKKKNRRFTISIVNWVIKAGGLR